MAQVAVSNRVIARSRIGRFIADCEDAGHKTVKEMVQDGAKLSRQMAPLGHKHDARTIPLRQSINWEMISRTAGHWYSTARHALAQELGAGPHIIRGNPSLSFFWEERGRMWIPAAVFYKPPGSVPVDIINHPGNAPQPYLRPAYEVIMRRWAAIARKHYP